MLATTLSNIFEVECGVKSDAISKVCVAIELKK